MRSIPGSDLCWTSKGCHVSGMLIFSINVLYKTTPSKNVTIEDHYLIKLVETGTTPLMNGTIVGNFMKQQYPKVYQIQNVYVLPKVVMNKNNVSKDYSVIA